MTNWIRRLAVLLSIGVLAAACTSDSDIPTATSASATTVAVVETPMESLDEDRDSELVLIGEPTIVRGDTIIINTTSCPSAAIIFDPEGRIYGDFVYKYFELSEEAPLQLRMRVPASIETGTYRIRVICLNGWDVFGDEHEIVVEVTGPLGPAIPADGVVPEDEPTLLCSISEDEPYACDELSPYPDHHPGVIG